LQQARSADRRRREGRPLGSLHGIPVGIKDIIDTPRYADRKRNGTARGAHAGGGCDRGADAARGGAVIMARPSPPNSPPMRRARPGIRTIRNIRRRFFQRLGRRGCGAHGASGARHSDQRLDDPAGGLLRRGRVQTQLRADTAARDTETIQIADQVGVFARSVEDAAFLAEQIIGFDERDPDTRPRAKPPLRETTAQEPPISPASRFVKTPMWKMADTRAMQPSPSWCRISAVG